MRGLVRIRAKRSTAHDTTGEGVACFVLPSWTDVEVFCVGEDGQEVPMTGVRSIRFEASDDKEPLVAHLTMLVDEIDVEAEVDKP